ncbi:MAG TPA: sialidase family protein [Nitrososphaerales archaeon]|nr:sialidase family protein [Nitrososphaerales archaeon]
MIRFVRAASLAIVAALLLTASVQLVAAASTDVSNGSGPASSPHIAVSGSHVYAVWLNGTKSGIFASISKDSGATWGSPFALSLSRSQDPHVAASGPNVYVTWTQFSKQGRRVVEFIASHNYGVTWTYPRDLSSPSFRSDSSRLVVSGSDVFVSWTDKSFNGAVIMFIASHDNGTLWGLPVDVSKAAGYSVNQVMTASQGVVYIAWQSTTSVSTQIRFSVSRSDGATFSTPINLSNDAGQAIQPAIAAVSGPSGNEVFVTWQDSSTGTNQIMLSSSSDSGSTWSSAQVVSRNLGSSTNPSIAASTNGMTSSIYVIWTLSGPHSSVVMEATSTNNGASFFGASAVSPQGVNATSPRIATRAGSSSVYIAWIGTVANGKATDAYLSTSLNGGMSWGSPQNVSNDGKASQVRLNDQTASTASILMVWVDQSAGRGSVICTFV